MGIRGIDPLSLDLDTSWKLVVNITARSFYQLRTNHQNLLNKRLAEPYNRYGQSGEEKILPT
jgi:hypothetical protein